MLSRVIRGVQHHAISPPLPARRRFTTYIADVTKKSRGQSWYYVGGVVLGCAVFGVTMDKYAKSEEGENTVAGGWVSFKERVMTSYEAKIRDLSSPEKVFNVFASVHKEDGKFYMTADDFIRALVPHEYSYQSKGGRKTKKDLPAAFKIADTNGDGLISFQEYLFFVTLLSIPEKSFQVAFKLIDEDGSGKIDQQEFMKVLSLVKKLSPPAVQTTSEAGGIAQGWLRHFFGPKGQNELTLEAFSKFLRDLNQDVLRMEYNLYDKQNTGFLSQREFGLLLVSFANPKEFFDRAESLDTAPLKPFSFEQFQVFNELIDHIDDVEMAMHLYQLNNRKFRKQDLQRLTRIVCKTELNPQVIDTIMRIFDKNGDGTLEPHEFVNVIKRRKARGLTTERDTGITRTLARVYDCMKNANNVN